MFPISDPVAYYVALALREAEQRTFDQSNPHLPPRLREPLPSPQLNFQPVRLQFNRHHRLITRP